MARVASSYLKCASYESLGWQLCLGSLKLEQDSIVPHIGIKNNIDISLKYLPTGFTLRFGPFDFLKKWLQDLGQFPKQLTSYPSPIRTSRAFPDTNYTGRFFTEESPIIPHWEDIDWENLSAQVAWNNSNRKLAISPKKITFLNCHDFSASYRKDQYGMMDWNSPLVNMEVDFHSSKSPYGIGSSKAKINLVFTKFGWWLCLMQYGNYYIDYSRRLLTMHCNFHHNVIYREILENRWKNTNESSFLMNPNEGVCFHDASLLNIEGASQKSTTTNERKYSSFSVEEWSEAQLAEVNIPKKMVDQFYANSGEKLQLFEKESETRLQILPLFTYPYCSTADYDKQAADTIYVPTSAYISGAANKVHGASNLLSGMCNKI